MSDLESLHQRISETPRPIPRQRAYVLYWMQASQRIDYNPALNYAQWIANQQGLPLLIYFGISENYPEAQLRHYQFMWEGLKELHTEASKRRLKVLMRIEDPLMGALHLSKEASWVVADQGYLRHQVAWREELSRHIDTPFSLVESEVSVPVRSAYPKETWQAGHLRKKLLSQLKPDSVAWHGIPPLVDAYASLSQLQGLPPSRFQVSSLKIPKEVLPVTWLKGGRKEALKQLKRFISKDLAQYAEKRNHLDHPAQSNLSPYLHFGQISPIEIVQQVLESSPKVAESFLDELLVRRELSFNFCHYNPRYDQYEGLPEWAKTTLNQHKTDSRPYIYTPQEWEKAKTHDPSWNAAQREMLETGKMHNYMRMYWGKKLLEWSETPEEGFKTAIYLNNKYSLDGRDPNSYAGVAWCFGKHDHPFQERPIYGKIRSMNANGLRKKPGLEAYLTQWNK
jgi:deoxyribodipyrimidine photo-lyase